MKRERIQKEKKRHTKPQEEEASPQRRDTSESIKRELDGEIEHIDKTIEENHRNMKR